MSELKITKEKVLAAAAKCSTAKETLQTLFPEAFEEEFIISKENIVVKEYPFAISMRYKDKHDLVIVYSGCQGFESFVLNSGYDWEIKDVKGSTCLVPTKQKNNEPF